MPTFATSVGLAALGVALAGCYSLEPLSGVTPEAGSRVAYDVNDAGRVALGGLMGPEIAQIEGHLLDQDSSGVLLSVTAIRLLRGGEQTWQGETVRLRPEHLSNRYERRVSVGRSIALGGIAIGGFTALLVSRSLLASGSEDGSGDGSDTVITRLGRP